MWERVCIVWWTRSIEIVHVALLVLGRAAQLLERALHVGLHVVRRHVEPLVGRVLGGAPGVSGKEPGQFNGPTDVAYDGEALFVADSKNNRVQKLRLADGAHLGCAGRADCGNGVGKGEFHFPAGMCLAAGTLYVCDAGNSRVVALGTALTWRYAFRAPGLEAPIGVVAHDGELYVVDNTADCVRVFAPGQDGRMQFRRSFGGFGSTPGKFNRPVGIAAVRGSLVVSENEGDGRVQVLSPAGVPLQVLAHKSSCSGICADAQRVWVTDSYRNRVIVLKIREAV